MSAITQLRNPPRRRGMCPGVLAPMEVGDGLLVRVRVPAGVLPAASAKRIAELGRRYGNGLVDLSHRGNLQLRGVTAADMAVLIAELRALGYVSADAESEAVRNVLTSPTAGLDGTAVLDVRPYALALDARLAADRDLHRLPPKFGWLVDGGGQATLFDSSTDVRFDAVEGAVDGPLFRVGLGGDFKKAALLGHCRPDDLVELAAALARAFLELRQTLAEPPRRMAGLVKALGVEMLRERVAAWLLTCPHPSHAAHGPLPSPAPQEREVQSPPLRSGGGSGWGQTPPTRLVLGTQPKWLGVAFPFGRLDVDKLEALAALTVEIRITPWRALLLAAPQDDAANTAKTLGGILDHQDIRLKLTACSGVTGCDVGTTDTHADGLAIAERAAGLLEAVRMVHVSGCAKGCAHPGAADVTLTARDGVYDVALNAAPGGTPWRSSLTPSEAINAVASLSGADLSVEELSRVR
ncbi:precorrin-3B synthase [Azospirillum brasilense]|uniref:Precorrin-3B synthase n=2 Tax=Azospirillum brasilense TaxID=192 RepID=A0A0P0F9P3_AZOBR|nr:MULTISPECIES: precorrin-3B synthase [Azospirillum]ALJ36820.1 precorrin-3B synthase [Azospirillum brasilense]MDW7555880.1 precorrin-3B synthase [Azospirillum brasilense]MDW7595957.1 precorrin-3B synthase [Azospirillum brasilense]MDW7630962.1 precorrin-3B synthase [Azospirillum brasilense]MDX5951568.1 precorrin-3B synthase [Azospirillum brasilense]